MEHGEYAQAVWKKEGIQDKRILLGSMQSRVIMRNHAEDPDENIRIITGKATGASKQNPTELLQLPWQIPNTHMQETDPCHSVSAPKDVRDWLFAGL